MRKILKFILLYVLFCGTLLIPNKIVKAETRDGIGNNSIKLLAYAHPYDIKQEWIEFKFVPQGDETAKLKCYSNGKFIDPSEIKSNLALYHKTKFKITNIYGHEETSEFVRGTSIVSIAQYLETLTFTYDADTIQVLPQAYYENEGLTVAKFGGDINSTLREPDFNNDLRFSARRELYRFRVRRDGLYAEYVPQVTIPDGEYIIETAENANKVIETEKYDVRTGQYKSLDNQKLQFQYDDLRKAYKV
ncbi:MAG: hypothetical protein Q4B63_04190, partial [Clostridium perfringens]|nr:hypothetical protein [Clostridium perfringens]